jgi:hypothetical protein
VSVGLLSLASRDEERGRFGLFKMLLVLALALVVVVVVLAFVLAFVSIFRSFCLLLLLFLSVFGEFSWLMLFSLFLSFVLSLLFALPYLSKETVELRLRVVSVRSGSKLSQSEQVQKSL